MSGRELVQCALSGAEIPRFPTGPLAVHFCSRMAGYSIRQYSTHARFLAESVLRYYERFKPDAVWISADTWVSAEAMGVKVGSTTDDQPLGGIGSPLIQTAMDLNRIPTADPSTQGRCPLILEALSRVSDQLGDDVFIVACFDQYPFSLAAALAGINEIMLKLTDDRAFVVALMERCLEQGAAYAKALHEAGAHMLSGGDAPAGLVSPQIYRELILPFERRLIARIKANVNKPVSLHICGRALPILADMAESGADVLEIDHKVNLEKACPTVKPNVAIWGNLDPVNLLAQGSPLQVRETARHAVQTVKAAGRKRFVLSSGCTLAMETPEENLDAFINYHL